MALVQRALSQLRGAVLSRMSLGAVAAPVSLAVFRGFAAEASYLDKNEVTDRVLNVVKGFEKVDAGKASGTAGAGSCPVGG